MKIPYVQYTQDTGEIMQWGETTADNPVFTPGYSYRGLLVLSGKGNNATHYVRLTDLVIVEKPIQPSINHVFDYPSSTWVDPRTLADMQALKWAEIKQARDLAEFSEFAYNGMVFDGDVDSQRRLAGYISISKSAIAAGTPFQAVFTLANNTEVVLSAQDFVGIELAKIMAVASAFTQAAALRGQIFATTSIAQVTLIQWNSIN